MSCFEKPSIVLDYCVKLFSFSCSDGVLCSILGSTLIQVTVHMQEEMGLDCKKGDSRGESLMVKVEIQ